MDKEYSDFCSLENSLTNEIEAEEKKNLKDNSGLALLYNERGLAKYKQVKFKEAVIDYEKALEFDQVSAFGGVLYLVHKGVVEPGLLVFRHGNARIFKNLYSLIKTYLVSLLLTLMYREKLVWMTT